MQTWLGFHIAVAVAEAVVVAVAGNCSLIRPLAWEPPYAMGVALKNNNNNKKRILFLVVICLFDLV